MQPLFVAKEFAVVVPDKTNVQGQLEKPAWRAVSAVQMHLFHPLRQVVRVALHFERRASADSQAIAEQTLQGDDNLFPSQRAAGPSIDAAYGLLEPLAGMYWLLRAVE